MCLWHTSSAPTREWTSIVLHKWKWDTLLNRIHHFEEFFYLDQSSNLTPHWCTFINTLANTIKCISNGDKVLCYIEWDFIFKCLEEWCKILKEWYNVNRQSNSQKRVICYILFNWGGFTTYGNCTNEDDDNGVVFSKGIWKVRALYKQTSLSSQ